VKKLYLVPLLVIALLRGGVCSARQDDSASPPPKKTVHTRNKKTTKKLRAKATSRTKRKKISPRVKRMAHAFVVSSDLKPMARQLLEDRTPAAYAGVQAYARRHSADDAGALAWLALGYARILDREYAKAIDPLKRAKLHAGDLGDYVSYFLATAYGGTGDATNVVATLKNFEQDYADSVFASDAYVVYATALLAQNQPKEAIALLERHRQPVRADVELALGRAYAASGDTTRAADTFRRLFIAIPTSSEAQAAKADFQKLGPAVSQPTFAERKMRAELLLKARRYSDAAQELRELSAGAKAEDKPAVDVALAVAFLRSGRQKESREMLEGIQSNDPEVNGQRLFELIQIARGDKDDAKMESLLATLRQTASKSPWLGEALLLVGNSHLLEHDYDKAIDCYREVDQRFPQSKRAPYAHWKALWLDYRQKRTQQVKSELEEQIAKYPASNEVPAALYWRARLAEDDHDLMKAKMYYTKLADRFPNYYYAGLASKRMSDLMSQGPEARAALEAADPPDPVLEKIPSLDIPTHISTADPPADDLRAQKALLLQNAGMTNFAVKELQAAAPLTPQSWTTTEVTDLYEDAGRYDRSIETIKHVVPDYFAFSKDALPHSYWEALFPKPYWVQLKKYSLQNGLDPFLVAALVRQESEFNQNAISHANAYGLMQLLPGTAKKLARQSKIRHFSASSLLVPNVNLQLGTLYFRQLVDQFGTVEYALAAYNAGADRIQDWKTSADYRDTAEFVESIPFTETREYVQAIVRNAALYRQIYGTP
jgi:soluble lytic murein transglycosylase